MSGAKAKFITLSKEIPHATLKPTGILPPTSTALVPAAA
jgi:hypothetical protein